MSARPPDACRDSWCSSAELSVTCQALSQGCRSTLFASQPRLSYAEQIRGHGGSGRAIHWWPGYVLASLHI